MFVPSAYKGQWMLFDSTRVLKVIFNQNKFRKVIGEFKARKRYEKWFRVYYDNYLKCKTAKPKHQVYNEMKELGKYWGVFPFHYFTYKMYDQNTKLSKEEQKNYVPEHFMYYWYYTHLNGDGHKELSNKKYLALKFKELDIRHPHVFFLYEKGKFFDLNLNELSEKEALDLLPDGDEFISKPFSGAGGKDIFFFNKSEIKNGRLKDVLQNNTLIQEKMINSNEIRAFHPSSLNTIRVYVKRDNQGPEILFTAFRIGRGKGKVDNAHANGIFLGIDKENGQLFDIAYDNTLTEFTSHPDTNINFGESQIKAWDEIRSFVIDATEKFTDLKMYGWDIAMTDKGPMAIEINSLPGVHLLHSIFGGIRETYGINEKIIRKVGV